jgi:hypothetical protein
MMYPAALSLLASAYLALTPLQANAPAPAPAPQSAAPSASAPKGPAFNFVHIGKTTFASVFIDSTSVLIDKDSDGNPMYGMVIKIELDEPVKQNSGTAAAVVNLIAASCALESVMVIATNTLDENGKSIGSSEKEKIIHWVKGSDSATNVIMSKLCASSTAPAPAVPKKNIKGSANI